MPKYMPRLIDVFESFRPPEDYDHDEKDSSDAELCKLIDIYKEKRKQYKVIDVYDDEYVYESKKAKK